MDINQAIEQLQQLVDGISKDNFQRTAEKVVDIVEATVIANKDIFNSKEENPILNKAVNLVVRDMPSKEKDYHYEVILYKKHILDIIYELGSASVDKG